MAQWQTYKSQVYFNGEYVEAEWQQNSQGKILAIDIMPAHLSWLSMDMDFRNKLYNRSLQIVEAQNQNHGQKNNKELH